MIRAIFASMTVALILAEPSCGAGAQPPASATNSLVFIASSDPRGLEVDIVIDAFDQHQSHGMNAATGQPYPWDTHERTPFRHTIYYEPGLIINASMTVGYLGRAGDTISCTASLNGEPLRGVRHFATVPEGTSRGRGYIEVHCLFVAG